MERSCWKHPSNRPPTTPTPTYNSLNLFSRLHACYTYIYGICISRYWISNFLGNLSDIDDRSVANQTNLWDIWDISRKGGDSQQTEGKRAWQLLCINPAGKVCINSPSTVFPSWSSFSSLLDSARIITSTNHHKSAYIHTYIHIYQLLIGWIPLCCKLVYFVELIERVVLQWEVAENEDEIR